MKSITPKFAVAIVTCIVALCSCSSWHYNHPRVKVDPVRTQEMAYSTPVKNTTASQLQEDVGFGSGQPATEVSSTEKDLVIDTKVKENKIPSVKTKASKTNQVNLFTYTKKLISESKLLKVKEVEKSALSGWLRIMIILIAVGFVLLIIGVILSVVVPGPVWWLFYLFGALLICAGLIVMILGLVGVMS